jgi:hypothetical protein
LWLMEKDMVRWVVLGQLALCLRIDPVGRARASLRNIKFTLSSLVAMSSQFTDVLTN